MLRTTLDRMRGKAAVRALLPFLLLPGFGAAAVERPNLLVLVADDVGWVDLGTGRTNLGNGSRFHETPNLARLAAEGMSFTAAYAQQNCAPTRASLLTGQYPTRHAVYNVGGLMAVSPAVRKSAPIAPPRVNRKDIRPSAVTLAETLGKAGSEIRVYSDESLGRIQAHIENGHVQLIQIQLSESVAPADGQGLTRQTIGMQ